jgi:hypothetical protein
VENAYVTGTVIGDNYVDIICTVSYNGQFSNIYFCSDGTSSSNISEATKKSSKEFASGEVCYLLNANDDIDEIVWYQTIGESDYPTFSGSIVNAYTAKGGNLYGNDGTVKSANANVTAVDITTLGDGINVSTNAFKNCKSVIVYVKDGDKTDYTGNVTKKYVVDEDSVAVKINNADNSYKFSVVVNTAKYGGSRADGALYLDEVDVIDNEIGETKVTNYTEDGNNIEFKVDYDNPKTDSTVRGQVRVKEWDSEDAENPIDKIIYYVTKPFNVSSEGTISN